MSGANPRGRFRKVVRTVAIAMLLAIIVLATVPTLRDRTLRSLGWLLISQDELAKADVIAISADSVAGGALEAADLVAAGFANRVVIFNRPQLPLQRELARRGAPPWDQSGFQASVLRSQNVNDIVRLPPVAGTSDEARMLREWCAANSIHSVIFVSDRDHSRRTRRVLARTLGRDGVRSIVRYTPWSPFDPDNWWHSRDGQRIQIEETEKLLLDYLAHPF